MSRHVYALRDRSGDVLYVGVSFQPFMRMRCHQSQQPWGQDVAFCTIEATVPQPALGEAYEWAAIQLLEPRYNVRGTQRVHSLGGWETRRANREAQHGLGGTCADMGCPPCRKIRKARPVVRRRARR